MIDDKMLEMLADECVDTLNRNWLLVDTVITGRLGVRLTRVEAIRVCRRALEKMEAAQ